MSKKKFYNTGPKYFLDPERSSFCGLQELLYFNFPFCAQFVPVDTFLLLPPPQSSDYFQIIPKFLLL